MQNKIISKYKCTGYARKFIDQEEFEQDMGATNTQNRVMVTKPVKVFPDHKLKLPSIWQLSPRRIIITLIFLTVWNSEYFQKAIKIFFI